MQFSRGGCGLRLFAELASPARHFAGHRMRQTCLVREADGHECGRSRPDGRGCQEGKRPFRHRPGLPLRRQHRPPARSHRRRANWQAGLCPFGIFFPGSREHARKWLRDPVIAGGGAIADVGVHCIDALRYILQDEVVRVTTSGITEGSNGVDLAAIMTLGFTRGTLGTILVSFISRIPHTDGICWRRRNPVCKRRSHRGPAGTVGIAAGWEDRGKRDHFQPLGVCPSSRRLCGRGRGKIQIPGSRRRRLAKSGNPRRCAFRSLKSSKAEMVFKATAR